MVVTDDPGQAADEVHQHMPDLTVDEILGTPYLWIGTVDSICEQVLSARERWGFSYFTVFQDSLARAGPIVARLRDGV